jgi:hypothetical protein
MAQIDAANNATIGRAPVIEFRFAMSAMFGPKLSKINASPLKPAYCH